MRYRHFRKVLQKAQAVVSICFIIGDIIKLKTPICLALKSWETIKYGKFHKA